MCHLGDAPRPSRLRIESVGASMGSKNSDLVLQSVPKNANTRLEKKVLDTFYVILGTIALLVSIQ